MPRDWKERPLCGMAGQPLHRFVGRNGGPELPIAWPDRRVAGVGRP